VVLILGINLVSLCALLFVVLIILGAYIGLTLDYLVLHHLV
jgi:hypothetical protein